MLIVKARLRTLHPRRPGLRRPAQTAPPCSPPGWRPGSASRGMNIFGGNGYMDTHPAECHLRDAMMCCYIDGLNDTTRLKLGGLLAGEAFAGAL